MRRINRLMVLLSFLTLAAFPYSYPVILFYTSITTSPNGQLYDVHAYTHTWVDLSCCQYAQNVEYRVEMTLTTSRCTQWDNASGSGRSATVDAYCTADPMSTLTVGTVADFDVQAYGPVHDSDYVFDFIDSTPEITFVNPGEGEPGDSGEMDVSGDNLQLTPVSVFTSSGDCGLTFGTASSHGRYSLSVPYTIGAWAPDAQCEIKVSNGYTSSTSYQNFRTRIYAPEISSLYPESAQRGTSGTLRIDGGHFYPEETQVSSDCPMSLGSATVQTKSVLVVPYTVLSGATPGSCTIQVGHRGGWTTGTNNFAITQ